VLTATGFFVVTAGLAAAKQFNVHGGDKDTGTRPAPVAITVAPPVKGAVAISPVVTQLPPIADNPRDVERENLP
jgi:hypothetical protein